MRPCEANLPLELALKMQELVSAHYNECPCDGSGTCPLLAIRQFPLLQRLPEGTHPVEVALSA